MVIIGKLVIFVKGDICDFGVLDQVFLEYNIYFVIYFVGLKVVGELVQKLLEYY